MGDIELFHSLVQRGIESMSIILPVLTGQLKRNFMDSFEVIEKESNNNIILSVTFHGGRLFTVIPYAKRIFDERFLWSKYPFITSIGGDSKVPMQTLGITAHNFGRNVSVSGNSVIVRKEI